jgi:nucleoside-diphosphate-sugar epimerase
MHISIVGCGWLGQPLAEQVKQSGHSTGATCRSPEKRQTLEQLGYSSHVYQLGDALTSDALKAVFQSSLLILNLPPGGRHIQPDFYIEHMCQLLSEARQQGVRHVIFISTTAVYGDMQGRVVEQTPPAPKTESGRAHQIIEQHALEVFAGDACVLRLAGLVGVDRHPAKYLAARTDIRHGSQVVNLVYQQDVITAIEAIIEQDKYAHIFHLCAHEHPTRHDYYRWACAKLGLDLPEFVVESHEHQGKIIDAHWTCETLGLEISYASPYAMLA